MICCWSHRKKKKRGKKSPFFKKNSKQEVDYANNTWDKKNKQQSSLSFSARHYSHKPSPILAVTCVYFFKKTLTYHHPHFYVFLFFFSLKRWIQSNKRKQNIYIKFEIAGSVFWFLERPGFVLFVGAGFREKKKVITHSSWAPSAFFGVCCCCCSLSFVAFVVVVAAASLTLMFFLDVDRCSA